MSLQRFILCFLSCYIYNMANVYADTILDKVDFNWPNLYENYPRGLDLWSPEGRKAQNFWGISPCGPPSLEAILLSHFDHSDGYLLLRLILTPEDWGCGLVKTLKTPLRSFPNSKDYLISVEVFSSSPLEVSFALIDDCGTSVAPPPGKRFRLFNESEKFEISLSNLLKDCYDNTLYPCFGWNIIDWGSRKIDVLLKTRKESPLPLSQRVFHPNRIVKVGILFFNPYDSQPNQPQSHKLVLIRVDNFAVSSIEPVQEARANLTTP